MKRACAGLEARGVRLLRFSNDDVPRTPAPRAEGLNAPRRLLHIAPFLVSIVPMLNRIGFALAYALTFSLPVPAWLTLPATARRSASARSSSSPIAMAVMTVVYAIKWYFGATEPPVDTAGRSALPLAARRRRCARPRLARWRPPLGSTRSPYSPSGLTSAVARPRLEAPQNEAVGDQLTPLVIAVACRRSNLAAADGQSGAPSAS